MSQQEVQRAQVLDLRHAQQITRQQAAQRLGISPRQVRRIAKRYAADGLVGLINRQRGKVSNRKLACATRTTAISLIAAHYPDFGPTLACEKLAERHDLHLSIETTRQLMMSAGMWKPKRGHALVTHPMRVRRARFGEMIQIDGSPHDWFEGRSAPCTLIVFIDDATSRLTQLCFMPSETTLGYMAVLYDHIQAYGVPVSLYSDKHSVFRINAKDVDADAETPFGRAARELGIESIHAHSPQAKGRVERANQTLQDRLVKEMRLAGINDMTQANAWLSTFIADYNRRFAVQPTVHEDAHLAYTDTSQSLAQRLSVQTQRTLSKNLSCQYENELMQVETTGKGLALRGAQVVVYEHFDGRRELRWQTRKLTFSVHSKPMRQTQVADGKTVNVRVNKAVMRRNTGHVPAANHPWRKLKVGKAAQGMSR